LAADLFKALLPASELIWMVSSWPNLFLVMKKLLFLFEALDLFSSESMLYLEEA